ncbi:pilus assembly protein [Collimonas pratensis]|uniref:pilus assembly protein n=1 Tax=Collimonas pratensis TaxID=279113 RepID=UPI0009EDF6F3|nr:PilC/PilY family type IV pilus protein [Collimonas pratensis]
MLQTSLSKRRLFGRLARLAAHCACLAMGAVTGTALAAIAQTPLFLPVPPPPNIMYMLDNSGSMVWGSVTGLDATAEDTGSASVNNGSGNKNTRAYYSSDWNQIYYNPAITYAPGVTATGGSMGAASTGATMVDPYLSPSTKLDNIGEGCYVSSVTGLTLPLYTASNFTPYKNCSQAQTSSRKTLVAQYAFYYKWTGSGATTGQSAQEASYTRVDILSTTTSYPQVANSQRTDCASTTACTYQEEIQNFANWFSYYRTRILMTKTALGTAFSGISAGFRVGFATIDDNNSSTNTSGANFVPLATFDATQKPLWYGSLYAIKPGGGTPLVNALNQVGQYYMGNGMTGYPASKSGPDPILLKCQANYTILSTDGYWNGTNPSSIGNQDKTVPTLPAPITNDPVSGTALIPGQPFPAPFYEGSTATSNTLADTAMKYWATDIGIRSTNTGTAGQLKVTPTDTATWQHMVTHTIGLGANGTLANTAATYNSIVAGTTNWPVPAADSASAIDDLWHAAINGHGSYFSAKSPQLLRSGLNSILAQISKATGSGGGFSYPGTQIGSSSTLYGYVPSFDAGTWTGHLTAYPFNSDGSLSSTAAWDAATVVTAQAFASRNIVTWNPTTNAAVNFTWPNLTSGASSQQTLLGSSDIVDYLRGNGALEQPASGAATSAQIYRSRQYKLGDIVNSSPAYVQGTDFGYAAMATTIPGASTYQAFVTTKAARSPMLYVGANDGMLHGFDATSGSEKFAFIPNSIYGNLKSLSSPTYSHLYFVDGPVVEGDAYWGGGWKNIVLGTTGAGGKSVFAVDVTTPGALTASSVLWEYNNANTDADMGNVLGAPAVVLLANNQWAAIYGNGYNSTNGHAVLYLVDVKTGLIIKKIDTGVGSATAPNGLSGPTLLFNANRQLITAYAGDLQGNLWKFDLSNPSDITQWTSNSLFVATDAQSTPVVQPIVQAPAVVPHPLGGYLVMVGTGKYIDTTDLASTQTQTVYGIWDKPGAAAVTGRSQLQQQTLTNVTSGGVLIGRTLSANPVAWGTKRGWYIDLPGTGERTTGGLQILQNVILLSSSLTPNTTDPCAGGGTSQIMGVNFLTGAASPKFHLIITGTPAGVNLSSATVPGTVGTAAPVPNPDVTKPGCINTVGLDGKVHCTSYQTTGTAVRRWRQLSIKPN